MSAIFILDVVFGNPYILRQNALIFAKYSHDTVIALYRNSCPASYFFVAQ